jgi:hypothetical protein
MSKFAAQTSVSPEKSRAEIEEILKRYGASHYGYMSSPDNAAIAFQAAGRRLRFTLPMPKVSEFKRYRIKGRSWDTVRTDIQAQAAHEKAIRQRWRALALVIKAKLESVETGVATFEEEFMANIVLPSGQTMAEYALPQIAQAYESNTMPPLLGYSP